MRLYFRIMAVEEGIMLMIGALFFAALIIGAGIKAIERIKDKRRNEK